MHVIVGTSVAQHLFSVASGLESMVVGEDEIAGQVREALGVAQREGTTTPSLERLLQRALTTSKSVTSSTGLGVAGRSIVSVGLDLVEQRHGHVAVTGLWSWAPAHTLESLWLPLRAAVAQTLASSLPRVVPHTFRNRTT